MCELNLKYIDHITATIPEHYGQGIQMLFWAATAKQLI